MSIFYTPGKRFVPWVLALGWLSLQPVASWVYYETNLRRGAYPPEADSIIIGQMQAVIGWGITLPVFLAFFWFCLRHYPGRVSLFAFDRKRPLRSSVWTVILLAGAGVEISALIRSVAEWFPLDVLSESLAIYLLLCCRSSLVYPKVEIVPHQTVETDAS